MDDFSFLELIWAIFIIYAFLFYFMTLFWVLADLFRDHTTSGWAKGGWIILLVVLPILGLLVYLLVRGRGMAERTMQERTDAKRDFDAYVRDVAATDDPAGQIARAKELLDAGAIDQQEFDALKRRALAT